MLANVSDETTSNAHKHNSTYVVLNKVYNEANSENHHLVNSRFELFEMKRYKIMLIKSCSLLPNKTNLLRAGQLLSKDTCTRKQRVLIHPASIVSCRRPLSFPPSHLLYAADLVSLLSPCSSVICCGSSW